MKRKIDDGAGPSIPTEEVTYEDLCMLVAFIVDAMRLMVGNVPPIGKMSVSPANQVDASNKAMKILVQLVLRKDGAPYLAYEALKATRFISEIRQKARRNKIIKNYRELYANRTTTVPDSAEGIFQLLDNQYNSEQEGTNEGPVEYTPEELEVVYDVMNIIRDMGLNGNLKKSRPTASAVESIVDRMFPESTVEEITERARIAVDNIHVNPRRGGDPDEADEPEASEDEAEAEPEAEIGNTLDDLEDLIDFSHPQESTPSRNLRPRKSK